MPYYLISLRECPHGVPYDIGPGIIPNTYAACPKCHEDRESTSGFSKAKVNEPDTDSEE